MPNRIIRSGFLDSEKINSLTDSEQIFFIRLTLVSDDYGHFDARPEMIRSQCWPITSIPIEKIRAMILKLQEKNLIMLYEVQGKQYIEILNFNQRLRLMKPKFPMPVICQTSDRHLSAQNDVSSYSYSTSSSLSISSPEPSEPKTPEPKTWRTDFAIYETEAGAAFDRIVANKEWIAERKKYHPALNIVLSLEKAFNDFWGQPAGWGHKKRQKCKEIDWDATFKNALTLKGNQVYEKRS